VFLPFKNKLNAGADAQISRDLIQSILPAVFDYFEMAFHKTLDIERRAFQSQLETVLPRSHHKSTGECLGFPPVYRIR